MFKRFVILMAFSLAPLSSQAKTITATGPTLDSTEAKIAAKAAEKAKDYKIIGANMGNYVYMIAKLTEK